MSLTQNVIRAQQMQQSTAAGVPLAGLIQKQRQLEQQLEKQRQVLRTLQDANKDESNVRLDKRENISIKRRRQIEKHRNRYVKEGIKHKASGDLLTSQQQTKESFRIQQSMDNLTKTKEEFEQNLWRTPDNLPRSLHYEEDESKFNSHDNARQSVILGDGAFFANKTPVINADLVEFGRRAPIPIGKINIVDQRKQIQEGYMAGLHDLHLQKAMAANEQLRDQYMKAVQGPYWAPEQIEAQRAMEMTASPAAIKPSDFELYRRFKLDQLEGTQRANVITANLKNSGRVSPLSMERSSSLSSMQVVAKRYSPKMINPSDYLQATGQLQQLQQAYIGAAGVGGHIESVPVGQPSDSQQAYFLQDMHDLQVSGLKQGLSQMGQPMLGQSGMAYSGQAQQSDQIPGSTRRTVHDSLYHGSPRAPGGKKILLQRKTTLANKEAEEHLKYLQGTRGRFRGTGYRGQILTQNERFSSIPENVLHEHTMGGTYTTKNGEANMYRKAEQASAERGSGPGASGGFASPQEVSENTNLNLQHAKYAGTSDVLSRLEQAQRRSEAAFHLNRKQQANNQFHDDKPRIDQANKTGGKINLERNGRDTILGGGGGGYSRQQSSNDRQTSIRKVSDQEKVTEPSSAILRLEGLVLQAAKDGADQEHELKGQPGTRKLSRLSQASQEMKNMMQKQERRDFGFQGRETRDQGVHAADFRAREGKQKSKRMRFPQDAKGRKAHDAKVQSESRLEQEKNDDSGRKSSGMGIDSLSPQSPKYPEKKSLKREGDNSSSKAGDRFGASMYNISPIEVYIENRSVANTNAFKSQLQKTTQNQRFKFPKMGAASNNQFFPSGQAAGKMLGQATEAQGFGSMNYKHRMPGAQGSKENGSPNPNNPYFSYYIGGKQHNNLQVDPKASALIQTNMPLSALPQGGTASPKGSRIEMADPDKTSGVHSNSLGTGIGDQHSRPAHSKLSKMNVMQPIYKRRAGDEIEIGGQVLLGQDKSQQLQLRETTYLINELHDLQEQTAEDLLSQQEGINLAETQRRLKQAENAVAISAMSNYYFQLEPIAPRVDAFKSKEVEKVLQLYANQQQLEGNTAQILFEIAQLGNKQLLASNTGACPTEDTGLFMLHDPATSNKMAKHKKEKKDKDENLYLNEESLRNKRNYEELYYRSRHQQRVEQYLDVVRKRMGKQGVDPESMNNLQPKYMDEPVNRKINKTIQDIELIKLGASSPSSRKKRNYTNLETILEKQQIAINSEGQESLQIENIVEEESNAKIDVDNQIQARFSELMDKGLYFSTTKRAKKKDEPKKANKKEVNPQLGATTSTLTKGWEGWETDMALPDISRDWINPLQESLKAREQKGSLMGKRDLDDESLSEKWKAIEGDPSITKHDVSPENDEVYKLIKERYMGLDDEHNRRKRLKDKLLEVGALQEKYLKELFDRSERASHLRHVTQVGDHSRNLQSQFGADSQISMKHDPVNPFDLPKNKVLTKNYSKVSLSPSNIMPGGGIKELDIEMRQLIEKGKDLNAGNASLSGPRDLSRNYSKATLQPGLNRNLSQKTIATLMTVQESETSRKKTMKKHQVLLKYQKDQGQMASQAQMKKKKENVADDDYYAKVLNNSNFVLPSLFSSNVASVAMPEHEILSTRTRLGEKRHSISKANESQKLNMVSLQQFNQQQNLKDIHDQKRKFKSLNTSRHAKTGSDLLNELNTTAKMNEFSSKITGPDPSQPHISLYYRKDLSYLDKQLPKLRNPSVQPGEHYPSSLPMLSPPASKMTRDEILASFKKAVILKHSLRGPKFKLTDYAQYLKESNNAKLMQHYGVLRSQETSQQLRAMLDDWMD